MLQPSAWRKAGSWTAGWPSPIGLPVSRSTAPALNAISSKPGESPLIAVMPGTPSSASTWMALMLWTKSTSPFFSAAMAGSSDLKTR